MFAEVHIPTLDMVQKLISTSLSKKVATTWTNTSITKDLKELKWLHWPVPQGALTHGMMRLQEKESDGTLEHVDTVCSIYFSLKRDNYHLNKHLK